ncbi:phage tail family protein [Frondihabitans sp. 762G35]|uniref:phage tail family protein n=1 Tax=Frondihabitans sp. 762G35 TaxID=1446794 RepID=UPI001F470A73|nr:phage tail family protein [Frondihabitans sp. 762G35]
MTVHGSVEAPSNFLAAAAIDRLNQAVDLNLTRLTIDEGTGPRWVDVFKTGDVVPDWINDRAFDYSFAVGSDDWRKFGTEVTDSTKLPSTVGGLTLPHTIPFSINATSVTGQVKLTNPGNERGPVMLRIDGPCAGPVITHVSSGAQLIFSSSLVLGPGEYLEVDMEKKTAKANGQSSRSLYILSRGWSNFDPGNNTWSFTAATFNANSKLTVTARPAWL